MMNETETETDKTRSKQTYFDQTWLVDEEFGEWVVEVKGDNTKYRCKVCRKTNEPSNMGKRALTDHQDGKTHDEKVKKVRNFFTSGKKKKQTEEQMQPASTAASHQTTIDGVVTNSSVAEAEIRWIIKCTMAGFSNNSNAGISDLFSDMFNSPTAKKFQLGPDKIRYSINFGLGPYFKACLMDSVKNSGCYILSFDESLNKATQTSEMDLMVRYFDRCDFRVHTRYVTSEFLGHARHTDLYKSFIASSDEMDERKLLQVSMDGPSVNHLFLKVLNEERNAKDLPKLIDIGTCGLHTVHGGFKTGAEKTDWSLKKTLKSSYRILHDSPARRDDYESVSGSTKYPLAFCATRWIEDAKVSDRLIELWPSMKLIMNFWSKLQKSKQPKNKSYEHLQTAITDKLVIAKLGFFSFFAELFKPFLTGYQTDQPMIPYLYGDLYRLLNSVLSVIVKPDVLEKHSTAYQLTKLKLNSENNILDTKGMNVGFVASTSIKKLKKKDEVSTQEVSSFYAGVKTFVKATALKLFEKIPVVSKIVRNASIFNPHLMATSEKKYLFIRVQTLVSHLVTIERIDAQCGDKVVAQYKSFLEENAEKFKSFKRNETRLDEFFFTVCGVNKSHPELASVIEVVLTLSHGQAAVERNFSLGKSIVVDNISERTIKMKKVLKDHMYSNKLNPRSIVINKSMYASYKQSRVAYKMHLEEEKKKKVTSQNTNQKATSQNTNQKAIIGEEINSVKMMITEKGKARCQLEKEAFAAMEESVKGKDTLTYAKKAVALKRSCEETKEEVASLEKTLSILEEKRAKL